MVNIYIVDLLMMVYNRDSRSHGRRQRIDLVLLNLAKRMPLLVVLADFHLDYVELRQRETL